MSRFRYRLGRRGNTAIEFGLIAPILVTILMGASDYGLETSYNSELQEAVRAGAAYATATGRSTDQTDITTAIQGASPLVGVVVAPLVSSCLCANGTFVACTGATCGDGSAVGNYVTLSATYTYAPFVSFFSNTARTLTSTLTIRTS